MNKFTHTLWLATTLVSTLSLSSCADGFEEESNFDSGIHHKQLVSPESATATKAIDSSGEDIYLIHWPVVYGAGGYEVNVDIVDDPENPVPVIVNDTIDGCSLSFNIKDDTKYNVQIRSLANTYWKKTNNKDASAANAFVFNTAVPGYTIPEGTDIAAYINEFFANNDSLAKAGCEVAFELEAGKNYTLDTLVNTTLANVIIRGDKVNKSLVTLGKYGGFSIYGGFKLKFLNFDCAAATGNNGILNMGSEKIDSLYYKYSDDAQIYYHDVNTILVQNCVFKDCPNGFFADGGIAWCVKDFRIKDCYIEQNPDDSKLTNTGSPLIAFDKGGNTIKDMTWTNSTFVNRKISSAYFIRFSNGSNSSMKKAYGSAYSGSFTMDHCTLIRTTANGQFGNNCWTTGAYTTIDWKNCIFYDCRYLQKLVRNLPCNFNNSHNTIWQVTNSVDNSDKEKYATEEDPAFEGGNPLAETAQIAGWDFTLKNGGLNYKPTNGIAASNQFGDPRWFE